MPSRVVLIAVSTALLTGCGGGATEKASTDSGAAAGVADAAPAGAPTRAARDTPDACRMITPADLAEVFAPRTFVVDTSGPVPHNQPGSEKRNAITGCTYTSGTTMRDMMSINVMVVTAPNTAAHPTVEQMKQGVAKLGLNAIPVDIAGLGDAAYWVNLGSPTRSSVAVNVRHAPRQWLTVSESSSGNAVDETVARLMTVARKVLTKL